MSVKSVIPDLAHARARTGFLLTEVSGRVRGQDLKPVTTLTSLIGSTPWRGAATEGVAGFRG